METKAEKYERIVKFIDQYLESGDFFNTTLISHTLNLLKSEFEYMDWVGIYEKTPKERTLFLSYYVGGLGCDLIRFERGVCGRCARTRKTQLCPDIPKVPYHIACSDSTKSEIVLPIISNKKLLAVLDLDSDSLNAFDEIDQKYLEEICSRLSLVL